MATIVFSKPVPFPIGALREVLTKHLPLYRWQCGEADTGEAKQLGSFTDNPLITGRSEKTVVFVETRAELGTLTTPAPPHTWRLRLGQPTTELTAVGDRLILFICEIAMIADPDAAWCQLREGGNWLTRDDLLRATKLVLAGEPLAVADGLGRPPAAFASEPSGQPHAPALEGAVDRERAGGELSALIVLADRALPIDGVSLERMARDVDPDGTWRLDEHKGQQVLIGRGTVLGILSMPMPLPEPYWSDNWTRSHWFAGDRGAVARHTRHITVKPMLDTRRAEWIDIRQVAKVAQLAACWIARQAGALAIVNLDVGTTFEATDGRKFLGHLGQDQLSVGLWSWTKVHGATDGDVSLSTSGLLPFLGHELELWNAPLAYDEAGTLTGDLIRYLLDAGPVIGHNDTAGRTAGDKSIRCFLGPSRAERPHASGPVQALFLEVDAPAVTAPRPDVPETPKPPMGPNGEAMLRDFVARVGGRDTTGVADTIRGMLAENEAAKDIGRVVQGAPLDPKLAETDRLLRVLKQDADGTSAEAIEAMQQALRDPPPRDVIESDANPFFVNLMKMIDHEQSTGALPTTAAPTLISLLALTRPVGIPTADLLREMGDRITPYRWTLDDGDRGLNVPRLLTGVGPGGTVTARLIGATVPLPAAAGAPTHRLHVRVETTCGADRALAGRIAAVVCCCLTLGQDAGAHGKLSPGSDWLDADTLLTAMSIAKVAPSMSAVAPDLDRVAAVRPAAPVTPAPLRRVGGFGRKGL